MKLAHAFLPFFLLCLGPSTRAADDAAELIWAYQPVLKTVPPNDATKSENPVNRFINAKRFRYLENADGSVELFDMQADSREWKSLAGDAAHDADLAAMKKLADDYKAKFRKTP